MVILNKDIIRVYNKIRDDICRFRYGVVVIDGGIDDGGAEVVLTNAYKNIVSVRIETAERDIRFEQVCVELNDVDAPKHLFSKWNNVIFDVQEVSSFVRFCAYLNEFFTKEQIRRADGYCDGLYPFG